MGPQDIIVTTNGEDGLWGVYPVTLRGIAAVGFDGSPGVQCGPRVAQDIVDRARKKGFDVAVVDWPDEITEIRCIYQKAELEIRHAQEYAAKVFTPLIEAAFAAKDQKEVSRLAAMYPDPVAQSFIFDRLRHELPEDA